MTNAYIQNSNLRQPATKMVKACYRTFLLCNITFLFHVWHSMLKKKQ